MISPVSEFRLLERGFKKTLCLVPGWATDYRIFSDLDLDYNYLLPVKFSPFSFKDGLAELLNEKSLGRISLLGWSLGGFLAAEFACGNPGRIEELILVSMRENFEPKKLETIKAQLKKNKKAYLYQFYRECFSDAGGKGLSWFRKKLLRDYLSQMELESLMAGLDYLSGVRIDFEFLASLKKLTFFHGLDDKIAPLGQAQGIKAGLPQARFIDICGSGHAPFLSKDFREKFYHG